MPKVLRILNRLNLGGPTYNASYLTKYLAPEYETLFLAGLKDDSEESSEFIPLNMGLKPQFLTSMRREINFLNDYSSYQEIKKIIRAFKPDIVHTHAAKSGAVGRMAASACKVPVIVHTFHGHVFHSYFSPMKTQFFIQAERYLANKSSAIVAISDKQKFELVNTYSICPENKVKVIPLGFELDRFRTDQEINRKNFREKYGLGPNDIAVGLIGRIVPIKNHALFIEAFAKGVASTQKKIHAFIIGDGELRSESEDLAKQLGLKVIDNSKVAENASIVFTSWITEIEFALAGLDIVAMSSLNEGTPVSLIEAQAAGKPILSTRIGGVEDVVVEGITALLSESGNLETFSANLLRLIEDDALRSSFAAAGWAHVHKKYHVQSLSESMRVLYRELLSQ